MQLFGSYSRIVHVSGEDSMLWMLKIGEGMEAPPDSGWAGTVRYLMGWDSQTSVGLLRSGLRRH